MSVLSVKNLSLVRDGKTLLRDVSFELNAGECCALIGPNGAGKSTLAATLLGLDGYQETTGEISLANEAIENFSFEERVKKGLTMMWQEPARFEGLSVREYLTIASQKEDVALFADALAGVGLDRAAYLDRMLDKNLSGGERKRIELAAILLQQPKVVILDEPDSGLDVGFLPQLQEYLSRLAKPTTAVLVISHIEATLDGVVRRLRLEQGALV